jgi:hypothetical protein
VINGRVKRAFSSVADIHSDPIPEKDATALRSGNVTSTPISEPRRQSLDNAKAESFMKTLKQEEIDGRAYRDAKHARRLIGTFIEEVYNRQRLHSALAYRPRPSSRQACRR